MPFVYFALSEKSGLVKIGWSGDPVSRMRSLSAVEKAPVRAVATVECGNLAGRMERAAHRFHAEKRVTGEWFRISPEEIESAVEHVKQQYAMEGGIPGARRSKPTFCIACHHIVKMNKIADGWLCPIVHCKYFYADEHWKIRYEHPVKASVESDLTTTSSKGKRA